MGRGGSLGSCCLCFLERMSPGLWKGRGERVWSAELQSEKGVGGSQLPLRVRPWSCGDSPLPDLPLLIVTS